MKITQGALASLMFVLACAYHLPAQEASPDPGLDRIPPEPINLDIPPQEPPDPEFIRESELAIHAIRNPHAHHQWLLEREPERGPREQVAILAIIRPEAFRRAFPPDPEQIRAEAVAAHAILNPRFPELFGSNQD